MCPRYTNSSSAPLGIISSAFVWQKIAQHILEDLWAFQAKLLIWQALYDSAASTRIIKIYMIPSGTTCDCSKVSGGPRGLQKYRCRLDSTFTWGGAVTTIIPKSWYESVDTAIILNMIKIIVAALTTLPTYAFLGDHGALVVAVLRPQLSAGSAMATCADVGRRTPWENPYFYRSSRS